MLQKPKERNFFFKVNSDHFEIDTISFLQRAKQTKIVDFFFFFTLNSLYNEY